MSCQHRKIPRELDSTHVTSRRVNQVIDGPFCIRGTLSPTILNTKERSMLNAQGNRRVLYR
jgi:hypothetical protein